LKILYIDLLSPVGHLNLNKIFLNLINNIASLDVASRKDYIKEDFVTFNKVLKLYPIPGSYYNFNTKLDYRIKNIKKIKWVLKNIEVNTYDIVFISSYETISFSMAWPKKIKPRVLILNHNNIEELKNGLKYFFFRLIPDYVEHIVFENYMKEYLISKAKILNKIWVLPYPFDITKLQDSELNEYSKDKLNNHKGEIIFAPSNSNDEEFIMNLINSQKRKKIFVNLPFKIVIRSRKYKYKDEKLLVYKDYLEYKEYLYNFSKAKMILLPFPKTYKFRISGVLFDCIVFRKKFLASSNIIFKYYIGKYPTLGYIYKNFDDLLKILNFIAKQNSFKQNFLKENIYFDIQKKHSRELILKKFREILK